MSNRDSMGFGDLLPQDVVEVFAQERHSKRSRKKRSNSLGRALGWLKGKKRKDLSSNGQNLGLGPALDLALDGHPAGHQGANKGGKSGKQNHPYGNSHAAPKRDDDDKAVAPPLLQENVFIETSRPKYLEDLHTEALEGLKMMQQEENNTGVEFQDNESTISTMTMQTDGESGGFTTDSTIPDTSSVVSAQSSVSTRSSRSGLTRQGSTFRPLKRSEKAKRRHRRTVGGIPSHVRREMGLDRAGWSLKSEDSEFYNGETDSSTTSNGPQRAESAGTSASLRDLKIIKPLSKDQIEQLSASHAGHRDDLALLPRLSHDTSDEQRPRSLAVPWMTTANSLQPELPGPVITMSPQAAYMSKIIPNAVLPPSIEVVEISRGRSRSSLRTVSKSSLMLSSPAPSRASSRASSTRTTSSKASTITSASRYNPLLLSDSSGWSNSESSDTLVSDSSTISSSTTPRQTRSPDGDSSAREERVSIHSSVSKASRCTSNGKALPRDVVKKDGFVRSLSVTKPKRAPLPPNRSYSLHNKMKRRSRDLQDTRATSGESSPKKFSLEGNKNKSQQSPVTSIDSPSYHADTSSFDDSLGSESFSPFRSQLQTLNEEKAAKVKEKATKDAVQEKQDNKLSKVISPSSGYSSQDAMSPHSASPKPKKGIFAKLQKLFPTMNSAGSSPSPEKTPATGDLKNDLVDTVVVSPSVRTLRDLFNIPPPPKVHAPPAPPPEVWVHSRRSVELLLGPPVPENLYAIIKKNPKDRRQQRASPSASTEGSSNSLITERKLKAPAVTVESVNGSIHALETKMVQESRIMTAEMYKENNERLAQNVGLKGRVKVMEKEKVNDVLHGKLVKAVEKQEERLAAVKKKSAQGADTKTNMDPLPTISLARISPSPSPKVVPGQTVASPESSWPAPPPPTMGVSGPDEVDLALPPPPLFGAVGLVLPVQVPPERSGSSQGGALPALTIPPPPSYTAPPPPLTETFPPTTKKGPLPSKDAFPPPPQEFAQQPSTVVLPAPPKEFTPTPVTEVFPPPPSSPPPPPPSSSIVVSPSPPPPPSAVVSPPAPPPPSSTVVSPPAPPPPSSIVVSPPPPPPPSSIVVSPPLPPPPSAVVSPPAPPPPSSTVVSPPPPPATLTEVSHVRPKDPKVVSPSPVQEVSSLPPENLSLVSAVAETPVIMLAPPSSIPPTPPLPAPPQSSNEDSGLPQDKTQSNPEISPVSVTGILGPPLHIPPPPTIQLPHQPQMAPPKTATQEAPPSEVSVQPTTEISASAEKVQEPVPPAPPVNIPVPPPLPVQDAVSIKPQPISASTESKNQEPTSLPNQAQKEESAPIITPSLLQTVKLRSVNGSPEPPKTQEQPESEVTLRKKAPSNEVPTTSASGETPQKPIRKSLIMTTQPALPKSQSPASPAASSSTALPSVKKSPTATASPSMNLQEAIRLRTAGRSKESPSSRLSLHSPTSPIDPHKSPSSMASFIFSKSNKKVMIEPRPASDNKAAVQKNKDVSPVANVGSEAESLKTGAKVPPPVAKKPKAKGKENENGEEMEKTAGQEEQENNGVKTNGTAGSVEGETALI